MLMPIPFTGNAEQHIGSHRQRIQRDVHMLMPQNSNGEGAEE